MKNKPLILFVLGLPQPNRPWQQQCVWYRVIGPGQALQSVGWSVEYAYLEETERIRWLLTRNAPDAIILHRGTANAGFASLRRETKMRGVPVWYDLDDNIIDPQAIETASHLSHLDSSSIRAIQDWTLTNIACLAECDGALFSTPVLRDIGLRHNGKSKVAANFLPAFYAGLAELGVERQDHNVRIYYGPGSIEHKIHFDLIAAALPDIMRQFPTIEFYIGGGLEPPRSLEALGSRVIKLPWVRPEIYYRMLGLMDIALAPLAEDSFSAAKSWIKVLEAASAGCIWIGSNQPGYREFSGLTGTGHLVSGQSWASTFRAVLKDFPAERRRALKQQPLIRERFSMMNQTGQYLSNLGFPPECGRTHTASVQC
jgi:glycosyltransferase involved in cell wall biosynthesis